MRSGSRIARQQNQHPKTEPPECDFCAGGFTLLEVLVALVVLVVGVSITLAVITGSLGNIRKVRLRTRAVEYAQSVMDASLSRQDLEQTASFTQNLEDGFRCTVNVQEYDPAIESQPQIQTRTTVPVKLMQYTVEMTGPDSPEPICQLQPLKPVNAAREEPQPILR